MSDTPREQQEASRARMVEFWRHYDAMEARLSRPLTERMLDLAGVSPRMHVLDVACGRGEPAVPAAQALYALSTSKTVFVMPAGGDLPITDAASSSSTLTVPSPLSMVIKSASA